MLIITLLFGEIYDLKKIQLLLLIFILFMLASITCEAAPKTVDTLTEIENGVLNYSELSDNKLATVKVDLKTGEIVFKTSAENGEIKTEKYQIDTNSINLTTDLLSYKTNYVKSDVKAIFMNK